MILFVIKKIRYKESLTNDNTSLIVFNYLRNARTCFSLQIGYLFASPLSSSQWTLTYSCSFLPITEKYRRHYNKPILWSWIHCFSSWFFISISYRISLTSEEWLFLSNYQDTLIENLLGVKVKSILLSFLSLHINELFILKMSPHRLCDFCFILLSSVYLISLICKYLSQSFLYWWSLISKLELFDNFSIWSWKQDEW
jgi:hypothetical protein